MNKPNPPNSSQPTVIEFPDNASLDDQAASWLGKLDADQPSAATIAGFKQWLNQSPQHRAVFERHQALWADMNVLAHMDAPVRQQAKPQKRWLFNPAPALAACLLTLMVITGLFFSGGPDHYQTAIGEQKTVQLNDGTVVLLNTNTLLEVHYSDQRRRVNLVQGEAHFEVAHNPARPFEVLAGQGWVQAVGTAFTVYLKSDDVEVVVTEGVVAILPADTSASPTATSPAALPPPNSTAVTGTPPAPSPEATNNILAGHIATYDRHTAEHVMQVALSDPADKLSWHKGMLVFRDEPLQQVVEEINRYTQLKIIIPSPQLREMRVGGFFKVSDIASVFEALEQGFDIHAKVISEGVVYLEHKQP